MNVESASTSIGIPMHSRFFRARLLAAALGVVGLAACENLSSDPPPIRRWGSIGIEGTTSSATTVDASVMAIFFDAPQAAITNSTAAAANDACRLFGLDADTVDLEGTNQAGETLALTVGQQTIPMTWKPFFFRYESDEQTPFTYSSGQSATINIPGNGDVYPAGSISVQLAEPLIVPDVTMSATQPMTITWNATNSSSSAVLLNLLYASPGSTGSANMLLSCELKDDGNLQIPQNLLTDFMASPTVHRKLVMTRFRTNQVDLDSRTLLHINSAVVTDVTLK